MVMKHRREGVIAIDNGGHSTCVVTSSVLKMFPSAKGECMEMPLENRTDPYDFIMELNDRKYVGGTLAYETELPLQMHSDSKQHIFYDLSILTAIHQWGYDMNYVVTCIPIEMMKQQGEKDGIRERLVGEWKFTVNGETKHFKIADVKVAPETVVPFWIKKPPGKSRWIDWGSRTIGYGTTINDGENMKFVNIESGTFMKKGLEAINSSPESLADFVAGRLLAKWDKNDIVYHVGGGAKNEKLMNAIKTHFPNSEIHEQPQSATAKGLYILGKEVYQRV